MQEEDDATQNTPPQMYWRYVWRNRVKAKFFTPYRAIPTVVAAVLLFIWKHNTAKTPFSEMWVTLAITGGVYLALFWLNILWSFVMLTPPRVYDEQRKAVGELSVKLSVLESLSEITPTEQRRRQQVLQVWQEFTPQEKAVVRFIFDRGEVNSMMLGNSGLDQSSLFESLRKAMKSGLLMHRRDAELSTEFLRVDKFWVNPTLRDAIEFVLSE